eukprot:1528920-Alexandrium_andersonii.AAC.1
MVARPRGLHVNLAWRPLATSSGTARSNVRGASQPPKGHRSSLPSVGALEARGSGPSASARLRSRARLCRLRALQRG